MWYERVFSNHSCQSQFYLVFIKKRRLTFPKIIWIGFNNALNITDPYFIWSILNLDIILNLLRVYN